MDAFETLVSQQFTQGEADAMTAEAFNGAVTSLMPACEADLNVSLRYPNYWLQRKFRTDER